MTERARTLAGGEPSQSKPSGFASSPKGRALRRSEKPHGTEKPLPLGEVALRSDDGEGKAVSKKKGVFHEGDDGC